MGERFFDTKTKLKENKFSIIFSFSLFLSVLFGIVLGIILIGDNVGGYAEAYSNFSGVNYWIPNLQKFLPQWLTLLGVDVRDGIPFKSIDGIKNLFLILNGFLLLVVPMIMLKMYRYFELQTKMLIISHWVLLGLIMIGYIFGGLSAANWRLSPVVASCVLLNVIFIRWLYRHDEYKRFSIVLICFYSIIWLISALQIIKLPTNYKDNQLYSLTTVLEKHQLSYGYATFWNANSITVISNSEVKSRCITISNGEIEPCYYQSQKAWFKDQDNQTQYFLLLTTSEYHSVSASNRELMNQVDKVIEYDGFMILVFNDNIF